jgi:hypothetical protein
MVAPAGSAERLEMENQTLEIYDLASVQGEEGNWTVVGTRDLEPKFQIQLGLDGATIRFARSETLTLVQKAKKPNTEPGFYPSRSIMD